MKIQNKPFSLTKRLLLKEDLAYTASLLWTFNHALAYHLTIQTETTFTFLSVLGMTVMYWGIDHTNIA
jgi:hypothetical protein